MRPGMPLRSRERKLVDVTDQAEGRPEKRIEHQGSKDSEGVGEEPRTYVRGY